MGTALNGDCFVDHITFNARGRGQADLQTTNASDNASIHNYIVCGHFALYRGTFANGKTRPTGTALALMHCLRLA